MDKLVTAEPGTYPPDHVDTFKGNVDDNFRVGVKMTRKTVKMFANFYGCDIIMASPLGLRRSIEKEGWVFLLIFCSCFLILLDRNADYLTSIEVLVVDQMDALTMQNWEHVKVCHTSISFFHFSYLFFPAVHNEPHEQASQRSTRYGFFANQTLVS